MLNKDYEDILQNLSDNKVKYLVVGAYALGAHGYLRTTGDIDIWVETSSDNAKKVFRALTEFGAPLKDINEKTFTEKGIVFQIGVAPRRIDILTSIDGVDFQKAYRRKILSEIQGLKIPFLSKADLIKNKLSTTREKDKLDAQYLKERKSR